MQRKWIIQGKLKFLFIFFVLSFLICGINPIVGFAVEEIQKAVIATAASDWSSGAISIVDVDTFQATNNLLPSESDITVCAYGKYFYQIGRYGLDWVKKVDISDLDNPIWESSTMDDNDTVSSSNPHALVFVNATKAYLLRYGTNTAWIVNPSASSCGEFKIGTLDLSAYDDGDGSPEMTNGIVVGDKVFILLQRLDRNNNWKPLDAYVAVFNATTDQEIDTGKGENGLKGIKLPVKNPGSIQYVDGKIYVQAVGKWYGEYTGGIVSIDPTTYEVKLILDDGNDTYHPYGRISGMIIVNATKGYFVGYAGWGDNTLYSFNPSNGTVYGPVSGLQHINIAGMENGGAVDKYGRVWVTDATNHQIVILNATDDSIITTIDTELNPQKVVFVPPTEITSTQTETPSTQTETPSTQTETTQPTQTESEEEKNKGWGCTINPNAPFDLWAFIWLTPAVVFLRRKFRNKNLQK